MSGLVIGLQIQFYIHTIAKIVSAKETYDLANRFEIRTTKPSCREVWWFGQSGLSLGFLRWPWSVLSFKWPSRSIRSLRYIVRAYGPGVLGNAARPPRQSPPWYSYFKEIKCFFSTCSQGFGIVGGLRNRGVAWSASDNPESNVESCVWILKFK